MVRSAPVRSLWRTLSNVRFATSLSGALFALLSPGSADAVEQGGEAAPFGTPIRSVSGGVIQHVVFVIQENRSFNNLFMGFKGATTQNYGYDENGTKIKLHSQTIATNWDIDHSLNAFLAAWDNGKLDGWNTEGVCCDAPPNFAYAYSPKNETKTYWEMAEQYVLADHLFQSNLDASYVAHQYAIAAYSNTEVNVPSLTWNCSGGPYNVIPTLLSDRTYGPSVPVCQDYTTLGDELDAASLSWRYYTYPYDASGGFWNAYSAINHIFNGPDYAKDVSLVQGQFMTDVSQGNMAAVSWITPTYVDSDHAGEESTGGPAWVAKIVNAVGQSQYWDSTVIFIIWDDWGGWFDSVPPVYMDYDGLGFRIPLIAISAYAKQGYVSHVQYESSSVLRFIEDNFGLAQMAASDSRAVDPATDFFNFSQPPRTFVPFKVPPPLNKVRWNGVRPPVDGD